MAPRASNYSEDEDILLCRVYMEISQDPVIGAYQSADRFWSRIEGKFNEKKPVEEHRTKRSLQARIQTIEKAVKRLHGCIRQTENEHQSGASNEDIVSIYSCFFKTYKLCFQHITNYL